MSPLLIKYTATTSGLGAFEFTSLYAGLYRVEASKSGFRNVSVAGIKLDAGTQYSLPPIVMEVGPIAETVTVEAGANLVQTTSAQVSETVERKQIDQLPLLDRNPLALLSLQAGVANSGPNGQTNTVINGQRASSGNVTLDGINIQDNFIRSNALDFVPNLLLINQVSEFSVTTQNAGPQAGLGSSQVSFVTPSGTNNWHGEGFWYYRSNVMAANDWFNNAHGVAKPNLLQNQGGGSVGGPIFKNKLFVYGWYELLRLKQSTPSNFTVLTSDARNGTFTWVPTCTTSCPSGVTPGQPQKVSLFGPGGLRSSSSVDPFITKLLARLPTTINNPNIGDGLNTGGLSFNQRSNRTRDNYGLRFDYYASAHHSFAGTWAWNRDVVDRGDVDGGVHPVPVVQNNDRVKFLSTAWRWSPKSTLTNEVRFGFNFAPAIFATSQDFSQGFTLDNSTLLFSNPDSTFLPQGRNTRTYSWQDNLSWTRGNHTFSFGGLVQHISVHSTAAFTTIEDVFLGISAANPNGLQASDFTSKGGISANDLATANGLFTSLGGIVSQVVQSFNVTSRTSGFVSGAPQVQDFPLNNYSWYVGDSWRVRKNVTFSYGVRWEYVGRYNESNGLLLLPQIPSGKDAAATILSDATLNFGGGDKPPYGKDLNNFAPNVGLAWDPWGNGKTAIRAGYSIYFINDEAIKAAVNATTQNPGLSSTNGLVGLTNTISVGLPTVPVPPFMVPRKFSDNQADLGTSNSVGFTVDPNLRTPYVQQWNLTFQRELGWKTAITVSYLGNKGTKLYRAIDLNQVIIGQNGFLADFLRARSNGFANLAAGNGFDPRCNFTGCQPLTVFPNLFGGGLLTNGTVRGLIQQGQVGQLVSLYHTNDLDGTVQLVPNPVLFVGDLLLNAANSHYHAGVVEVRRRFGRGLYLQANYTFSKVLTDSSGAQIANGGADQNRFDPLLDNAQPQLERARADFDLTHAFKANFLYELPFGTGHYLNPSNSVLNRIASGWSLTSIFTWQSGAPFSILSGRGTLNRGTRSAPKNTASTTLTNQQVAAFTGVFFQGSQVLAIDPKFIGSNGRGVPADTLTCTPILTGGFCNPAPGTVGNLARNAFNGPPFFNWDFGVIKQTPITERIKLEYRAEFFNFLNHPSFYFGPINAAVGNENINSTRFGVITQTTSVPRVIQMGLRLVF